MIDRKKISIGAFTVFKISFSVFDISSTMALRRTSCLSLCIDLGRIAN